MKAKRVMLPKQYRVQIKGSVRQMTDGEPLYYRLLNFEWDDALSCSAVDICCDCGLSHVRSYRLVVQGGKWWLELRSFRVPGTGKEAK